ncbi:MAG: hypothetical protein PSX80_03160 [bacterium]|nr:hypothetical protein [bacterium]
MKAFIFLILATVVMGGSSVSALAQRDTYTGTVLSYGSGRNTRTSTNTFTLYINGTTSDADVDRAVAILQEGGQDDLLNTIRKNNLGNFSVGGRLGRDLIGVRVDQFEGKKRIRAIFERWINFGEIRGGYRSLDYPFGYLELLIDPATGKGDGTFLEAAKIRWKRDKKSNQYVVEIEDFGTFPARLMGISQRNR